MPALPRMGLWTLFWIWPRAAAAASRARPFGGHAGTLQYEALRYTLAVGTDDCVNWHFNSSGGGCGGDTLAPPPYVKSLGSYGVLQLVADEVGPLDQGMDLVLSDVSLQQDQATIGGNAQSIGRDDF
jgi:hypothetical protein